MARGYLKTNDGSTVEEIPLWLPVDKVESKALQQLKNIATLPWVAKMSVMPDCHFGKGATVGSVIGMNQAVSAAAVGVDLGCGLGAVKTNLDINKVTKKQFKLQSSIEKLVPVGFNSHKEPVKPSKYLQREYNALCEEFYSLTDKVQDSFDRALQQLGTLGGGNHFIEVNSDQDGNIWLMLHSGSRWIGKTLADVHISIAKELEHNQGIVDKDLAVFLAGTKEMEAYRRDLYWAQRYAMLNRKMMMDLIIRSVKSFWSGFKALDEVWCHHNYVSEELHYGEELFVTRKGAISAQEGERGIIPGAMGARSYIVRGKGNPEALCSAPHGAGRKMSRTKARKKYTVEDLIKSTNGVACRKDKGVLDEISLAYKNIDEVIDYSNDLVEVETVLNPAIVCVKG